MGGRSAAAGCGLTLPPGISQVYYKVNEDSDGDDGELTGADDGLEKAGVEDAADVTGLNILVPAIVAELDAEEDDDLDDDDDDDDGDYEMDAGWED